MNGIEADRLGAQLSLHLRRNEFGVCHEILFNHEKKQKKEQDKPDYPVAIAETKVRLRWVNILEKAGMITLEDLQDMSKKDFLRIPNFGEHGVDELRNSLTAIGFDCRLLREKIL